MTRRWYASAVQTMQLVVKNVTVRWIQWIKEILEPMNGPATIV
jgi:hypothetical protein